VNIGAVTIELSGVHLADGVYFNVNDSTVNLVE
jgi:hypothetical protein